jgi:hypothetical protein
MGLYLKALAGVFTAGVAFFAYSQQGCASGIAQQTCDTEVWKTMEHRAHIEAEREIMQNQNLIFKPDSVLAYTCFDDFAAHASLNVGQLFTHTKYWNDKEIIEWGAPNGMDNAMQKVVIDSMKPYLEGSFNYGMLGGRGNQLGASGLGPKIAKDIGNKGRTYSCDQMNKVWKHAKCLNFIHNQQFATTDGFYPFIGLEPMEGGTKIKGYDEIKETRKYPSQLACGDDTGKPIYNSEWKDAYHFSRNETESGFGDPNKYYPFGETLKTAYKDVREMIKDEGSCALPIYTGVMVLESASGSGTPYKDGVCTNPGCVYSKAHTSGSCVRTGGSTSAPATPSINPQTGRPFATPGRGTGAAE